MTQVILNESGTDRKYEDFPTAVTLQYLDKEGRALGIPQKNEFLTLASYILWVIDVTSTLIPLSTEYSQFAYFACKRTRGEQIELENQYVRRVYTFE